MLVESEDMPAGERKRCYAWLGRRLKKAASASPALIAKYDAIKCDNERYRI